VSLSDSDPDGIASKEMAIVALRSQAPRLLLSQLVGLRRLSSGPSREAACASAEPGRQQAGAAPTAAEPEKVVVQQPLAGRTRFALLTLQSSEPPNLLSVTAFKRKGNWAALRQALASFSEIRKGVIRGFLPKGYPHSVTSNYAEHIKWSFVVSVSGTVTGGEGPLLLLL
jgi:hypothetical protein